MLSNLLSRGAPAVATKKKREPKRLAMENLERRDLMTVTYHGGPVIQKVQTQAVFYGADWNTNATEKTVQAKVNSFTKDIAASGYIDQLSIYNVTKSTPGYAGTAYTITHGGGDNGVVLAKTPSKSSYLTEKTILADLQSAITSGQAANPDPNRLYVIYVEQGVKIKAGDGSTSVNSWLGYHDGFAGKDKSGKAIQIHYAIIAYPGGPNGTASSQGFKSDTDDLTVVASHEIAEAVTDPDVGINKLGWYDDNKNGEIGDIIVTPVAYQGYAVQTLINIQDKALKPAGATTYTTAVNKATIAPASVAAYTTSTLSFAATTSADVTSAQKAQLAAVQSLLSLSAADRNKLVH